MVYTFKLKADKLDSKSLANIQIPAIIYLINEGMVTLVKKRYGGLNTNYKAAYDEIQKRKDEFQRLVVPDTFIKMKKFDDETYTADLTELSAAKPYMFLLRTNFLATKDKCTDRKLVGVLTQVDDLDIATNSPLEQSSFEWGEAIFRIAEDKLRVTTDGTFKVTKAKIDYLRYPVRVDMAGYKRFDGTQSSSIQCELPAFVHDDIVEEALFIYNSSFNNPELQARLLAMGNKE
jgi:hypothetical protein